MKDCRLSGGGVKSYIDSKFPITSTSLSGGARNPIVISIHDTEVDDETYQKLLNGADVRLDFAGIQLEPATWMIDGGDIAFVGNIQDISNNDDGSSYNSIIQCVLNISSSSPHTIATKTSSWLFDTSSLITATSSEIEGIFS